MGIRNRLLVSSFGVCLLVLVVATLIVTVQLQGQPATDALAKGRLVVAHQAQLAAEPLQRAVTTAQVLADAMVGVTPQNAVQTLGRFEENARAILGRGGAIYAIAATIDYRYFNPQHPYPYGYRQAQLVRWGKGTLLRDSLYDLNGVSTRPDYQLYMRAGHPVVLDPHFVSCGLEGQQEYVVSACAPIMGAGDTAVGMLTVDLPLKAWHDISYTVPPLPGAYAMLAAADLTLVAYPNPENLGVHISSVLPDLQDPESTMKRIAMGDTIGLEYADPQGVPMCFFTYPVSLIPETAPWVYCMVVPLATLARSTEDTLLCVYTTMGFSLVALFVFFLIVATRFTQPLVNASASLARLSLGAIDDSQHLEAGRRDELGAIAASTNRLLNSLREKAEFAKAIGKGQLDVELQVGEADVLGQSLVAMQRGLQAVNERSEQQRKYEEQQAWSTRGVARFSELFRQSSGSVEDFSYAVLRELLQYIDANVGAIFLQEVESGKSPYYKLVASYAYQVRKYGAQQIMPGEGLVGRCAQEGLRVYLTEIPEGYVTISSGLGEQKPKALLLLPMVVNDRVVGVVEMASFMLFPEYKIQFAEQVVNMFGATLLTVRNHHQTKQLLEEARLRQQAQHTQEEVLKQNLEELQAIQESARHQEALMTSLNRALQAACSVLTYDLEARVVDVNNVYLGAIHASREQLIGTHLTEGMDPRTTFVREFPQFWQSVLDGQISHRVQTEVTFGGESFRFVDTYAPVLDESGAVVNVLRIAYPFQERAAGAVPEEQHHG